MKKIAKLYPMQRNLLEKIEENKFTLAIGQGRSGKTLAILYYLFKRAIKIPNSNHAIFRNTLSACVDGIFKITLPEVINLFFPALPFIDGFSINKSTYEIKFHNGSRICLKGLDSKERSQKLLSTAWQTIFIDEAHLVDFEYVGLILTRLPQQKNVDYKIKIICAANWAPKTSWLKLFFEDGLNPETKIKHNQEINIIKSLASDNKSIDAEEYLSTLKLAGDRKSRLMCSGTSFYEEAEGALWLQGDILRKEEEKAYDEIVIGFDPAVTNKEKSDEHGVTIAGKNEDEYHVLLSYEKKEDINNITEEICNLYNEYECSKLIYETNQGGDWIPSLIKKYDESIYCFGVHAKKSKMLRAESIAALYKNKRVYHTDYFPQLEDQMITYTGKGDSPNSLDSLVYAIKYLSENNTYVDPNDCI